MTIDETSRLALITGGTRGIGAACAMRLQNDGFLCVVTGTAHKRPDNLDASFGYLQADFRQDKDMQDLAAWIKENKPVVLVNNAGINIKGTTVGFDIDDYDALYNVNVKAPFVLIQNAIEAMQPHGWGRIVNITSLWGVTAKAKNAAYCSTKFGLDGLTASIAAEVAHAGILINSVAPGYIHTEAYDEYFSKAELDAIKKKVPMKRLGKPKEIAALVSWLVSEENSYMTGQNLLVDGGLTRTALEAK